MQFLACTSRPAADMLGRLTLSLCDFREHIQCSHVSAPARDAICIRIYPRVNETQVPRAMTKLPPGCLRVSRGCWSTYSRAVLYLAELRKFTLHTAHRMAHLSLQQVCKLCIFCTTLYSYMKKCIQRNVVFWESLKLLGSRICRILLTELRTQICSNG